MASQEQVFAIKCGCCGATIHVDPRTRSVYFSEDHSEKKKSFEDRVENAKKTLVDGAEEKFAAGLQKERDQTDRLERLFDDASEKAKEDPNERPPSIWDYE